MKAEVFGSETFKNWAKDNAVLLTVDFPRDKSGLPEETQQQNAKLKEQFKPRGYPTVIFIAVEGDELKEVARVVGYRPDSGPENWLERVKMEMDKAKSGDEEKKEGDTKE